MAEAGEEPSVAKPRGAADSSGWPGPPQQRRLNRVRTTAILSHATSSAGPGRTQRSRPNSQLTYISHGFGRSTLFSGNLLEQVVPERPRTSSLSHKPVLTRQGRHPRRSQPEHTTPSPRPQHSTPSPWPPHTVPPPWPQPPGCSRISLSAPPQPTADTHTDRPGATRSSVSPRSAGVRCFRQDRGRPSTARGKRERRRPTLNLMAAFVLTSVC